MTRWAPDSTTRTTPKRESTCAFAERGCQHQHYECDSTLAGPADLPSITFGDLSVALTQAFIVPGTGCRDRLLGGQCWVDDCGSAGHVYRLKALHDWRVHLADLRRQLDGPIEQPRMCNDLRDQAHRFGPGRIDDLPGHREPAGHPNPDGVG